MAQPVVAEAACEVDPGDIECPLTGELIGADDVDGLISTLERVQAKNSLLYAVEIRIRNLLASKTEGDAVTRRIAGKRRRAKVTLSDESFEQSVLKELWNSHNEMARQYMKIGVLNVAMREFKKLINTASDQADFVFFRDAMTKANRGRTGTPRVEIEV